MKSDIVQDVWGVHHVCTAWWVSAMSTSICNYTVSLCVHRCSEGVGQELLINVLMNWSFPSDADGGCSSASDSAESVGQRLNLGWCWKKEKLLQLHHTRRTTQEACWEIPSCRKGGALPTSMVGEDCGNVQYFSGNEVRRLQLQTFRHEASLCSHTSDCWELTAANAESALTAVYIVWLKVSTKCITVYNFSLVYFWCCVNRSSVKTIDSRRTVRCNFM